MWLDYRNGGFEALISSGLLSQITNNHYGSWLEGLDTFIALDCISSA